MTGVGTLSDEAPSPAASVELPWDNAKKAGTREMQISDYDNSGGFGITDVFVLKIDDLSQTLPEHDCKCPTAIKSMRTPTVKKPAVVLHKVGYRTVIRERSKMIRFLQPCGWRHVVRLCSFAVCVCMHLCMCVNANVAYFH